MVGIGVDRSVVLECIFVNLSIVHDTGLFARQADRTICYSTAAKLFSRICRIICQEEENPCTGKVGFSCAIASVTTRQTLMSTRHRHSNYTQNM
jgi:hypothetical protein